MRKADRGRRREYISGMAAFEMFEAIQARDWETAGTFVASDALIVWPATGERFFGERYLAMNRDYPEGWYIEVIDQD